MLVKTEAIDMILASANIKTQVMINKTRINLNSAIFIDNPIRTPKVVAMPLPPLNLKNKVQLCPHMQLNPSKIGRIVLSAKLILEPRKSPKKITGIKPFKISKIKTLIPTGFPNTRQAFVAPTLPEPNLRISIPLSKCANM